MWREEKEKTQEGAGSFNLLQPPVAKDLFNLTAETLNSENGSVSLKKVKIEMITPFIV